MCKKDQITTTLARNFTGWCPTVFFNNFTVYKDSDNKSFFQNRSDPFGPVQTRTNPFEPVRTRKKMRHLCNIYVYAYPFKPVPVRNAFNMRSKGVRNPFANAIFYCLLGEILGSFFHQFLRISGWPWNRVWCPDTRRRCVDRFRLWSLAALWCQMKTANSHVSKHRPTGGIHTGKWKIR